MTKKFTPKQTVKATFQANIGNYNIIKTYPSMYDLSAKKVFNFCKVSILEKSVKDIFGVGIVQLHFRNESQ